MIKFENGLVNISGKGIDILSEYAVITHEIKKMFAKNGGEEKEIKDVVRSGKGNKNGFLFLAEDRIETVHGRAGHLVG